MLTKIESVGYGKFSLDILFSPGALYKRRAQMFLKWLDRLAKILKKIFDIADLIFIRITILILAVIAVYKLLKIH